MKHLGTYLTNDTQYLFTENCIILLEKIERTQIDGVIYHIHRSDV